LEEGLDSSGSAASDSDNSDDDSHHRKNAKSKKSNNSSATDKVKANLAAAKKRAMGFNGTGGGAMKKVKRESDDFKVEKKLTVPNSNQQVGEMNVKNEVVELIDNGILNPSPVTFFDPFDCLLSVKSLLKYH
jgi:hypothetical protein